MTSSHRSSALRLVLGLALFAPVLGSCQRASAPAAAPAPGPAATPAAVPPVSADTGLPPAMAKLLPADAGPPRLASVKNLARLPKLDARHRTLLSKHGFFVAPQSRPAPGQDAAEARTSRRAKHLFQVYERNDYIRFPSYVTADLAIDLTHQYFDVVLRRAEREYLVPKLRTALQGFSKEAQALARAAGSPREKKAARAAAAYWATALRLLEQPASGDAPDEVSARMPSYMEEEMETGAPEPESKPPPKRADLTALPADIGREVSAIVAKVQRAETREVFTDWGLRMDLTQTKPRGHYTGDGVLQRYFRAMSFLGMSSFPIAGELARPDVLGALAFSVRGATAAAQEFEAVRGITAFVVGEPPTEGLLKAGDLASAHAASLSAALQPEAQAKILAAWAKLPAHPVDDVGPVVQTMGQRVFLDTLAMSKMLPILRELPPQRTELVARAMGAAGAAAVLGSDDARQIVVEGGADLGEQLRGSIDEGRALLSATASRDDAYHRTLHALVPLLSSDPLHFDPQAYRRRMLQTFAGGWAMLRHDTLLYAYQMGAECDAEDLPAPYGWVEPVPEVYAGLRGMITAFSERLRGAGIHEPPRSDDADFDGSINYSSIDEKTIAVTDFLKRLEGWSAQELRGEPFDEQQRTDIAMVGGFAEHVVLTLADAYELGEGNDDMAIIADVFTFQGRALEVGVGHPELVYAVVPTPEGWVVARGAVLAYRELFVDIPDRMTDETWRARLAASADFEASARPQWLADIVAEPVGVVELAKDMDAQHRCGYHGGGYEL